MELDRSFRKKTVPIPYGKLTTVFILFIASFMIWQVWENQNRLYTDNLYMKQSIFTGVMFQVEFLKEPDGEEIELYSFVTPDARVDGHQMHKDNQLEFSLLENKIDLLIREERNVIFYSLLLSYTLAVWFILRNLIRDSGLPIFAFVACVFFSFSLWRSWFKIQELLEETAYYMSRL
ncbi:hypothetical protein [Brevibacillus brevis]|uniref:hypothetical protein n=1 Tax=Brevibacillus brevis TaxID=1393 RepID=UPI000E3859C9|nr:hypothetical protein [Brevibacillus brevis]RED28213.1 hypothetical protein DES34_10875 [Brevibacillus brevis]VEF90909.1 Uncharacterised protein [Brevibacillus brevis]